MEKKIKHSFITLVVPAYNEQKVLPDFHARSSKVLNDLPIEYEILYINDGSQDKTVDVIKELREKDEHVSVVDLSRNFGKEIALTAGLDHAKGDAVIVIDADLQDPPELIPQLVSKWQEGYDVVYAKRIAREGETWFKKMTSYLFYRFIQRLSSVHIPEDVGDYRLISRRALDALLALRERHRFMKGLFAWVGFPQVAVPYHRGPRAAGETKWNYWKLWNFALEGITSFTTKPLKLASYLGLCIAFLSFIFGSYIIYDKLVHGNPVPGYPSLMVVILFIGGLQFIILGIMGEYLARTFSETKNRPLYLVKEYSPSDSTDKGEDKV